MSSAHDVGSRTNTPEECFKLFWYLNLDFVMLAHYSWKLEVRGSIPGSDWNFSLQILKKQFLLNPRHEPGYLAARVNSNRIRLHRDIWNSICQHKLKGEDNLWHEPWIWVVDEVVLTLLGRDLASNCGAREFLFLWIVLDWHNLRNTHFITQQKETIYTSNPLFTAFIKIKSKRWSVVVID